MVTLRRTRAKTRRGGGEIQRATMPLDERKHPVPRVLGRIGERLVTTGEETVWRAGVRHDLVLPAGQLGTIYNGFRLGVVSGSRARARSRGRSRRRQ